MFLPDNFLYCPYLLCSPLHILGKECIESNYYINLIGTSLNCHAALQKLYIKESLGSWESSCHYGNIHTFNLKCPFYCLSHIGIHTYRCRCRILREHLLEPVHFVGKRDNSLYGIGRVEGCKVHAAKAQLQVVGSIVIHLFSVFGIYKYCYRAIIYDGYLHVCTKFAGLHLLAQICLKLADKFLIDWDCYCWWGSLDV